LDLFSEYELPTYHKNDFNLLRKAEKSGILYKSGALLVSYFGTFKIVYQFWK